MSGVTWQELYCCQGYLAGAVLLSGVIWLELYCREAFCDKFPDISWPHVMSYLYLAGAGLMKKATRQELAFCEGLSGRNWPHVNSYQVEAGLM